MIAALAIPGKKYLLPPEAVVPALPCVWDDPPPPPQAGSIAIIRKREIIETLILFGNCIRDLL
jgi:hypothetical protein